MSYCIASCTGTKISTCYNRGWDSVEYQKNLTLTYLLQYLTGCVHWYNIAVLHAGVAELVDAPDSKSGGAKAPCRFEPDLRYF
jgi:hypothetical protein